VPSKTTAIKSQFAGRVAVGRNYDRKDTATRARLAAWFENDSRLRQWWASDA
jgi:hypothetical protein